MKVRSWVTLGEGLLRALGTLARNSRRSRARAAREARDLAILNAVAAILNREMEDVLAYQREE